MTVPSGYADLLAHHALVETLPAVVPMVVLVGAFLAIVVADRRRSRRQGDGTQPDGHVDAQAGPDPSR